MKQLPPQTWQYNGQTFSVSLFVEDSTVVGMTPVTASGGVVVPPRKYLGDHVANGLAKLGVKPCSGCNERKQVLNNVHRGASRLVGNLLG